MHDEITKHTKKIYDEAKNPKHSFAEKAKEIIIEIGIIVFAVTLSIWLHGWSEHRHEQEQANEFLKGLKKDLTADIAQLSTNKALTMQMDSNYKFMLALKPKDKADTAVNHQIRERLYYSLCVTRPGIGRYEGFKSSGKIETIASDSLKQDILILYQQVIPDLKFGEDYTNSLQLKMLDADIDNANKLPKYDFVNTAKMQSMFGLGKHNFEGNIRGYDKAIALAKKIISEINTATGE